MSFGTPKGAHSSIAVDPVDGTLWGLNEGFGTNPGMLVNYTRTGVVIQEIPSDKFMAVGGERLAVAVGSGGDSLWVVTMATRLVDDRGCSICGVLATSGRPATPTALVNRYDTTWRASSRSVHGSTVTITDDNPSSDADSISSRKAMPLRVLLHRHRDQLLERVDTRRHLGDAARPIRWRWRVG